MRNGMNTWCMSSYEASLNSSDVFVLISQPGIGNLWCRILSLHFSWLSYIFNSWKYYIQFQIFKTSANPKSAIRRLSVARPGFHWRRAGNGTKTGLASDENRRNGGNHRGPGAAWVLGRTWWQDRLFFDCKDRGKLLRKSFFFFTNCG